MVKVSPDEDSDAQISGICDAVWTSGVDGVIVGNTTNRRPETLPHLGNLSPLEEQHLLETGGFSGPHLYNRTLALVKKYKKRLANKPAAPQEPESPQRTRSALEAEAEHIKAAIKESTGASPTKDPSPVVASIDTGAIPPMNISEKSESEKQPLFKLPTDRFYDQSQAEQDQLKAGDDNSVAPNHDSSPHEQQRLKSIQEAIDRLPEHPTREGNQNGGNPALGSDDKAKVIFATGGITNGKQAMEILNAGADVAMVYTALVYGGVGTISRIKDEMRHELTKQAKEKQSRKGRS
jgi:dihydroorotate dehydrogenase